MSEYQKIIKNVKFSQAIQPKKMKNTITLIIFILGFWQVSLAQTPTELRILEEIKEMKNEMKEIRNETKNEMKEIRKEMTNIKVEIGEMKSKVDTKFIEMDKKFDTINLWLMTLVASYLGGFVGLAALLFWDRRTSQAPLERRIAQMENNNPLENRIKELEKDLAITRKIFKEEAQYNPELQGILTRLGIS